MPRLTAGLQNNPRFTGLLPDQKYILNGIGEPGFPTRLVWCLNFGNGKSVTMYMAILKLAMKYPGIVIWLGRNHYSDLKRSNLRLFFEIVPKDVWKYKIFGGQNPSSIVFPNGSTVLFMGFGDPGGILGSAPGAVFVEEVSELDIDVWNILEGRARQPIIPRHAQVLMGVGNPRGHYPLYRKFVKGEGMTEAAKSSHLWYKGDPFANRKNLPDNYYEDMQARLPKELYERFVLGSDDTHAGTIYPQFSVDLHARDAFKWEDHWIPYTGLDFGKTDPTAVPFLGFDPHTGDVWQIAEHYRPRLLVPRHCELMDEIALQVGFPKEESHNWADSNVADEDGGNGKSIQQWFAEGGWHLNLAPKKGKLIPGIEKVQNLLMPNHGVPKFHIHPRCVKTIEEFQLYEWAQPKGPVDMIRFKEEPRDDHNHAMDALRYAINAMPIANPKEMPHRCKSIWQQLDEAEETGATAIIWNTDKVPRKEDYPKHPLRDDD